MDQSSLEKFIEEETEKFISKWRNNGRPDVNDEKFQKFEEEEMNETIMRYKMAKRLQEELNKENVEEKWRKFEEEETRKALIKIRTSKKIEKDEKDEKARKEKAEKAKKDKEIAKRRKERLEYEMFCRTNLREDFCILLACYFRLDKVVEAHYKSVKDAKWKKKKAEEAAAAAASLSPTNDTVASKPESVILPEDVNDETMLIAAFP